VTLICAHRGASSEHPDNSMAAFQAAIGAGADMIETDVRRSPDGRLVLAHDPVAEVDGQVELEALVELARGRIRLDVELKEPGCEAEALELLRPLPDGWIVSSFLPEVIERVGAIDAAVRTGLIVGRRDGGGDLFARADTCGADVLIPNVALLDDALRTRALDLERPLLVWTVNDREQLARLVADPAVGCICTDVPALLYAVIAGERE
jgi:glycerophosphoryl diester phosphodiesterase